MQAGTWPLVESCLGLVLAIGLQDNLALSAIATDLSCAFCSSNFRLATPAAFSAASNRVASFAAVLVLSNFTVSGLYLAEQRASAAAAETKVLSLSLYSSCAVWLASRIAFWCRSSLYTKNNVQHLIRRVRKPHRTGVRKHPVSTVAI